MAENTEVKSNRDRYAERLKSRYPDKELTRNYQPTGKEKKPFQTFLQAIPGAPHSLPIGVTAKILSLV